MNTQPNSEVQKQVEDQFREYDWEDHDSRTLRLDHEKDPLCEECSDCENLDPNSRMICEWGGCC